MKKTFVYIVLILVLAFLLYYFFYNSSPFIKVSRIGKIDTKYWILKSDEDIDFIYPENLNTKYISIVEWPPKLSLEDNTFSCIQNISSENIIGGNMVERNINGKSFCVKTESEGAAGSVYVTYTYSSEYREKTLIATFTLRFPQCMNYDNPKQTECINEQKDFSIDNIISTIIESIK